MCSIFMIVGYLKAWRRTACFPISKWHITWMLRWSLRCLAKPARHKARFGAKSKKQIDGTYTYPYHTVVLIHMCIYIYTYAHVHSIWLWLSNHVYIYIYIIHVLTVYCCTYMIQLSHTDRHTLTRYSPCVLGPKQTQVNLQHLIPWILAVTVVVIPCMFPWRNEAFGG